MAPIEIIIIGTKPPCPRCALMGALVTDYVRRNAVDATINHIGFDSSEARSIASTLGLETGTAKHVAAGLNMNVDWNAVYGLIANPPPRVHPVDTTDETARKWSPELDESLKCCQDRAREAGILMTPVLVVNGEVRHEGDVPSLEDLGRLLTLP
ncbi:MAG: hypothetical protein GF344_16775 [Chitinivibrionales bacterium]|nr:hypothetical protein [Chitinivibrionales bacterium]MBD3358344.1 hypothetical protein [Chitinivibrionales bacterium]